MPEMYMCVLLEYGTVMDRAGKKVAKFQVYLYGTLHDGLSDGYWVGNCQIQALTDIVFFMLWEFKKDYHVMRNHVMGNDVR